MGCIGSKTTDADANATNGKNDSLKKQTPQKSAEDNEPDYSLKLLIVGDISVGKSNLVHRFTNDAFAGTELPASTGSDFIAKDITLDGQKIRLKIWDTAGQERFQQITASYFRGANGCILCYDITREETFNNLDTWVAQVDKQALGHPMKIIVGCKSDEDGSRAVQTSMAQEFATSKGFAFFEASAKEDVNVQEAWEALVRKCIAEHGKDK